MQLLFDFLPIFLFFITYKFYGIYAATVVAIISSLFQVTFYRYKNGRFESMHLITLLTVLLLGGTTLLLHNEMFIKWKPTILYWLLGSLFAATSLFSQKPLLQRLMEANINVPILIWRRLNMSWAIFFLLLGATNLFVIYHYNTNTWVNFKLFGALGLTLLFVLAQSLYMAKYITKVLPHE